MNRKFNKLFNLILQELTAQQKKYANTYQKMRKKDMSFGPIFKQERTYFPLDIKENFQQLVPSENIVQALDNIGFYITDYRAGIAMKKSKPGQQKDLRQIKIGKILNRLNNIELKKQFDERLGTSKKDIKNLNLQLCITYNPYDIAGMSTDRNWTSCMNLNGGMFADTAYRQVQYGGMCAYLINSDDKEIEKPYARIAIKRMIGKTDKNSFIFISQHLIYGDQNLAEEFKMDETLVKILNQSNQQTKNTEGIFNTADKESYSDNSYKIYYNVDQLDKYLDKYQLNSTDIEAILHEPIKLQQLQKLINNYPNLFNKNYQLWMLILKNPNFTCNQIINIFNINQEKLTSDILFKLITYLTSKDIKVPKLFIQKYFQYYSNYSNMRYSDMVYFINNLLETNSLSWSDIENLINKYQKKRKLTYVTMILDNICIYKQYLENIPIQFLKNNIKYFKEYNLYHLFNAKKFTDNEFNILINQLTNKQCYHLFERYYNYENIYWKTNLTRQQMLQLLKKAQPCFLNPNKYMYILERLKND